MTLPFALKLKPNEAAKISKLDGVFVVEPMRFLLPYQAKREAAAEIPTMCHHRCRRVSDVGYR